MSAFGSEPSWGGMGGYLLGRATPAPRCSPLRRVQQSAGQGAHVARDRELKGCGTDTTSDLRLGTESLAPRSGPGALSQLSAEGGL